MVSSVVAVMLRPESYLQPSSDPFSPPGPAPTPGEAAVAVVGLHPVFHSHYVAPRPTSLFHDSMHATAPYSFLSTYCCSALSQMLSYFLFSLALLPSHPPMLPSGHSHWRGGRSPSPMGQMRGAAWVKNLSLGKNPRGKRPQGGKTVLQRTI